MFKEFSLKSEPIIGIKHISHGELLEASVSFLRAGPFPLENETGN